MKEEVAPGLVILLLLLVGFLTSAPIARADASGVFLSAFTPKPPTMDGVIGASEWSSAATLNFTVTNFGSFSTNGTIYEMNDLHNLYIALRIADSTLDGRGVFIYFDNNHTGTIVVGDDLITYQLGGAAPMDGFISHIVGGAGYSFDIDAGGTTNGQANATNNGGYNYFEFSHPLCSGDRYDFCLSAGQTVEFDVSYGTPYGGGDWPQNLIGTTGLNASGYGDIEIQPGPFSLTPSSGAVGTSVTMTGSGFVASHAVTATYGSWVRCPSVPGQGPCDIVHLSTTPLVLSGSCTTSSTGSLVGCTFTVPSVPDSLSQHTVTVSDGTNNLTATFTVLLHSSTLTMSCSPNSVVVGSETTCKATVAGYSPTGNVTWTQSGTGSVSFVAKKCTLSKGTCSVAMKASKPGSGTVTPAYLGDSYNNGSSGTAKLTITKAPTQTRLSCTKSSFSKGEAITCTATVAGAYSSHTGTVTWSKVSGKGSVTFSSKTCKLVKGKCSVTVTGTAKGTITIKATYGGDPNNLKGAGTTVLAIA